jgi:glycosyltransferase involved in cell wall biosynthesis
MNIKYSIIAPIFNELDNLPELYARVRDTRARPGN